MDCTYIRDGEGKVIGIACGPRQRKTSCSCGRHATLECDWPTEHRKSGTCDKPICKSCARSKDGKDYCPFHRGDPPLTQEELELEGEAAATEAARILRVPR